MVHDLDFVHHLNYSLNASHRLLGKLLLVIAAKPTVQNQHAVVVLARHVPQIPVGAGSQATFCDLSDVINIRAQFKTPCVNSPGESASERPKLGVT